MGSDDINKNLKKVNGFLKDLTDDSRKIFNKVTDIPGVLLKRVKQEYGELEEISKIAYDTIKAAKDFVIEAFKFFKFWVNKIDKWKANAFQNNLIHFLDDIFKLPDQVTRILIDHKFEHRIPDIELANAIVKAIPKPALYGLSQGLETMPGWQTAGSVLLNAATKVPSITDVEAKACAKVLDPKHEVDHKIIVRADQLASLLIPTLELAIRNLPRDMSINATILGQGAGTQVSGHPSKMPLEWAKWSVVITDTALKRYLAFYKACKMADAAKREAEWKADVTERLQRIESK